MNRSGAIISMNPESDLGRPEITGVGPVGATYLAHAIQWNALTGRGATFRSRKPNGFIPSRQLGALGSDNQSLEPAIRIERNNLSSVRP